MLVFLSAILLSSATYAGQMQSLKFEKAKMVAALPDANAATKFDSLVASYNAGVIPQWSRIEGLWSGRCYIHTDKDTAKANLLVADKNTKNSDGPLFPSAPRVTLIQNSGAAADYFDELTSAEKAEIKSIVDRDNLSTVAEKDFWKTDNTPNNLSYQVRRNGDYYIALNKIMRDTNPPSSVDDLLKCTQSGKTVDECLNQGSGVGLAAGTVFAACYYFKKVP